ncbi:uncharacterized protein LOC120582919 [Pteropus medius]|uniref:uncharacterized protein LOC120582919 n=1 Tax=Pteropus vampyrus TaxID=132908 RepID=UPI00196A735F|nr:uncharacterized protein LOC120582919 [Pteropus giganteus]XP_039694284.1 uncharacterized protein LOC120582919 [Pteropus giganteus]
MVSHGHQVGTDVPPCCHLPPGTLLAHSCVVACPKLQEQLYPACGGPALWAGLGPRWPAWWRLQAPTCRPHDSTCYSLGKGRRQASRRARLGWHHLTHRGARAGQQHAVPGTRRTRAKRNISTVTHGAAMLCTPAPRPKPSVVMPGSVVSGTRTPGSGWGAEGGRSPAEATAAGAQGRLKAGGRGTSRRGAGEGLGGRLGSSQKRTRDSREHTRAGRASRAGSGPAASKPSAPHPGRPSPARACFGHSDRSDGKEELTKGQLAGQLLGLRQWWGRPEQPRVPHRPGPPCSPTPWPPWAPRCGADCAGWQACVLAPHPHQRFSGAGWLQRGLSLRWGGGEVAPLPSPVMPVSDLGGSMGTCPHPWPGHLLS